MVGAPFSENAAYVFVRKGTSWSLQQELTPGSRPSTDTRFGWSVAISGNRIVVGTYFDDSAYVFSRNHGLWTQRHKLTPDAGSNHGEFGRSVAISENTIVVGAPNECCPGPGAAYVFRRGGHLFPTFYLQQKLVASDGANGEEFGLSVAIDGATIVVGAHADNAADRVTTGAAYVFVRSGGVWSEQAKLTASDGRAMDHFGYSVAVAADTIVVGALGDDDDIASFPFPRNPFPFLQDQGSVYVFVRSKGTWSQQQKLLASDGSAHHYFGSSVAISGDRVVVGNAAGDVPWIKQRAAYVFERSGDIWSQQQKLTPNDTVPEDWFGRSVAIDADTVVVGSNEPGKGAAYVFVKSQQRSLP